MRQHSQAAQRAPQGEAPQPRRQVRLWVGPAVRHGDRRQGGRQQPLDDQGSGRQAVLHAGRAGGVRPEDPPGASHHTQEPSLTPFLIAPLKPAGMIFHLDLVSKSLLQIYDNM